MRVRLRLRGCSSFPDTSLQLGDICRRSQGRRRMKARQKMRLFWLQISRWWQADRTRKRRTQAEQREDEQMLMVGNLDLVEWSSCENWSRCWNSSSTFSIDNRIYNTRQQVTFYLWINGLHTLGGDYDQHINKDQHCSQISFLLRGHLHGRPGSSHWVDLHSLRSNYFEIAWNKNIIYDAHWHTHAQLSIFFILVLKCWAKGN